MASISKIILFLIPIVFFFGQLLRTTFFGIDFPVLDILIILIASINIINKIVNKKLEIKNKYFLFFLIFSYLSFAINLIINGFSGLNSLFYLVRLSCLISLIIFPIKISNKESLSDLFNISIFANVIFGYIQYIIWPDFTYFNSLNWDPHLYRLVSTYFDPTFTGLIYLFLFSSIYFSKIESKYKYFLLSIIYIAIALTYSRSTYLSFVVMFLWISIKTKNIKPLLISIFLVFITLFAAPRLEGEGTKLERTSSIKAKIENYKEAFTLYKQSPIIGIGYNNISRYRVNQDPKSHGTPSFEGSLVNILVTNGILGLILFVLGLKIFFGKSNIQKQSIIIATIFHSLFANSLLYPWVLIYLVLI